MTPLRLGAQLRAALIPSTNGGFYTLGTGSALALCVGAAYLHSAWTGAAMPDSTEALLTASVALLGVHAARAVATDRTNAAAGVVPVPVEPDGSAEHAVDTR